MSVLVFFILCPIFLTDLLLVTKTACAQQKARMIKEDAERKLVAEAEKEIEFMESLSEFTPQIDKLLEETNYSPNSKVDSKGKSHLLPVLICLAGLFALACVIEKQRNRL